MKKARCQKCKKFFDYKLIEIKVKKNKIIKICKDCFNDFDLLYCNCCEYLFDAYNLNYEIDFDGDCYCVYCYENNDYIKKEILNLK